MEIIEYAEKNHAKIVKYVVDALKAGKSVVFPTDTSYGLAVDAANPSAVKQLYRIKGRDFNKPVHVVAPSLRFCNDAFVWDARARLLVKHFWPGAVTLVVEMKKNSIARKTFTLLSAGSDYLGLRMPDSKISLDLARKLGSPITATSANISGQPDCYSLQDILRNFLDKKIQPDIILSVGKLHKKKPSTIVKLLPDSIEFIRKGPVSQKQIITSLGDLQ